MGRAVITNVIIGLLISISVGAVPLSIGYCTCKPEKLGIFSVKGEEINGESSSYSDSSC